SDREIDTAGLARSRWLPETENHFVSTTLAAQEHPFPRRIPFNYEFPADADWLNTNGRIRMQDLRGKYVIIDFWTYCCINCMHILPELKKLEETYPNQLVVIGVHSAKFETEQDVDNIRDAIMRYEIQHPVVNDPQQRIWNDIGVNAWPTLILIDPAGEAVFYRSGETKAEVFKDLIGDSIRYYRDRKLLD
ncbi:MAG: redoxin domain-containing protein, partial [Planctomycetaceae bacterium]|nr:redoxin domain-containing protein [Planctomycetaceae bacterium]